MPNIVKGPTRGYAKTLHHRLKLPKSLERTIATIAKPDSLGCSITFQGTTVDVSDTVLKLRKSYRVDEQRTAIILAQIAAVAYMQESGENAEVCWTALQGVAMLEQAFEGDFSDPRWPQKKSTKRQKSFQYRALALVLSLIRMRARGESAPRELAASLVVKQLDDALIATGIGIRIWDVSFKTEKREATITSPIIAALAAGDRLANSQRDCERRAEVERKLLGYMEHEEAATRTDKAMPATSTGAAFYEVARKLVDCAAVPPNLYEGMFEDAVRDIIVMSIDAQQLIVEKEQQSARDQNPPDSFEPRHRETFQDMRNRTDITDL